MAKQISENRVIKTPVNQPDDGAPSGALKRKRWLVAQSKAKKTPKRAASAKKRVSQLKVPDAVRKPANQLLASLTGVMGKELLAEALVTIAGALVGGRYIRSQSGSGDDNAPLSASEAIGRVLGTSLTDSGPKKNKDTVKKGSQRRTKSQESSVD